MRATPRGVMQQLITAYQNKKIDLYRDLFSTAQDFRFYVTPLFQSEYLLQSYAKPCEPIDTAYPYIHDLGALYFCLYYWTYSEEMRAHERLFQDAGSITFTVGDIQVEYLPNEAGDTARAQVVMDGGTIDIFSKEYYDNNNDLNVDMSQIVIGRQVFYLKKDPDDPTLWVIDRWFDLGNTM
jgi:hypothetical protein